MDGIVGVLHARDVLGAAVAGGLAAPRSLVRPTIFVPPNAQLDEVLARMKRSGHHLAIVVDEHGGFQGIVTLEDILEELVGEIRDEFDDGGEDPVAEQPDGSVIIEASISIRALNKRLGLDVPESSAYVTLAGFLLSESGSIPRQGSELLAAGRRFVVENIRRNRIVSVRMLAAAPS
jgi:putative hemolysin